MTALPERIPLDDVGAVLRRHRTDDLDPLHAAIEESRDHLRSWMVWADQTRSDTEMFLSGVATSWDTGSEHNYLIVDAADGAVVGGCGLHERLGPEALEIGYWRRAGVEGRGVVTAAARALTAAAFTLPPIERVEIHCDEANVASAAVARRAGYRLDRIVAVPVRAPAELGRQMIWITPHPAAT